MDVNVWVRTIFAPPVFVGSRACAAKLNSIIKMFIFCVVNTCAISRVYIGSLTPALPATATYEFSLSFSSYI